MLKELLKKAETIVVFKNGESAVYVEDSRLGKVFSQSDMPTLLSEYNDDLIHKFSQLDVIKIYQLDDYAKLKLIWERV